MKRFVVATEALTSEQEMAFLGFVQENSLSWWHRIDNVWLIVDRADKMTPRMFRDKIKEIAPGKDVLVLDILEVGLWSGYGPASAKNSMFEWLLNTWRPDKRS